MPNTKNVNEMYDDLCKQEIEKLRKSGISEEGSCDTVDNLTKLMKTRTEMEAQVVTAQQAETTTRWTKVQTVLKTAVDVGSIVVPAVIYGVWMKRGFEFEREGTYTSQTFRNMFSKLKPTK